MGDATCSSYGLRAKTGGQIQMKSIAWVSTVDHSSAAQRYAYSVGPRRQPRTPPSSVRARRITPPGVSV